MNSKKLSFSAELKRLRNKYMLTQLELSAYSGVPLPTIKRWETAQSIPNMLNLKKLIKYYEKFTDITRFEVNNLLELYSIIKADGADQAVTVSVTPKKDNKERFINI